MFFFFFWKSRVISSTHAKFSLYFSVSICLHFVNIGKDRSFRLFWVLINFSFLFCLFRFSEIWNFWFRLIEDFVRPVCVSFLSFFLSLSLPSPHPPPPPQKMLHYISLAEYLEKFLLFLAKSNFQDLMMLWHMEGFDLLCLKMFFLDSGYFVK